MSLCFLGFGPGTSRSVFPACSCIVSTCAEQTQAPCSTPPGNSYILRYSSSGARAKLTFIGNTLGLSKALCENQPGTSDAIGAFITIDPTQQVGSYPSLTTGPGSPAGTTISWQNNSSSAVYTFPAGTTVLRAELIWGGSYGYFCEDAEIGVDPSCILNYANGPISFTTPDGVTHSVTADPTTSVLQSQNPAANVLSFYCAGYYTRSQDVSALFSSLTNLNGTYTVGGVPATVSPFDDTHNCAGWTLAIVYTDPTESINNISIFVGNQEGDEGSEAQIPAAVIGFCTPSEGDMFGKLMASALEGDPNKTGDKLEFGSTILSLTPQSGPNNLIDNFFASQINGDNGQLLSTSGTFCTLNSVPPNVGFGVRQGYDITTIDIAPALQHNQNEAYILGTTVGDDYMINALGLQFTVMAPEILPMKLVEGLTSKNSQINDTVGFSITIDNTSLIDANNVTLSDILETGLTYVQDTFKVNGVPSGNPDLTSGYNLGTIPGMTTFTIDFQAKILSEPPSGNMFVNQGVATFSYFACDPTTELFGSNASNVVTIFVTGSFTPPTNFNGVIKKCEFLNSNMYSLKAKWNPSTSANIVSYRIYRKENLVATIPAAGPYVFETCLKSKKEAREYSIVSVSSDEMESDALNISVTNG